MTDKCQWETGESKRRPSLRGAHEAEVCVVGLGGSGLSCIEELRSQGKAVIGVDAGRIGGSAAGRNGGLLLAGSTNWYHEVVAQVGAERARAFYQETLNEIERMRAFNPESIRVTGSLRIAASDEEKEDCLKQFEAMRQDQLPVEWYEGPRGERMLFPKDAVMNPWERVNKLAGHVESLGTQLFEDTKVVLVGDGIVECEAGYVKCDQIVVAIDGRLEELVPSLGGRVRTARLQMIATKPVAMMIDYPGYFRGGHDYWQQRLDGRIFLGGGRDIGGDEEWGREATTTPKVQAHLRQLLQERFGLGEEMIESQWAACVGYTESGFPVIEEHKPGLWVLGGYSGTGNLIGALAGRAVAQKINGQTELWDKLLRD